MIEIKPECGESLRHLIKRTPDFLQKNAEVKGENPVVFSEIQIIIEAAKLSMSVATKDPEILVMSEAIAKYSCFAIYHLIRIQEESNDLERNN